MGTEVDEPVGHPGDSGDAGDAGFVFPADAGAATKLTLGYFHSCALFGDTGYAKCWGRNDDYGELGNGTGQSTAIPAYAMTRGRRDLFAGAHDTWGVLAGGGECAGKGGLGELGDGIVDADSPVPVATSVFPSAPTALASGDAFTCALLGSPGQVWCVGDGTSGELGNGALATEARAVQAQLSGAARAIAAFYQHACAVLTDGTVEVLGRRRLGAGGRRRKTSTTGIATPTAVAGISGATAIGVGQSSSCALTSAGGGQVWGAGETTRTWGARQRHDQEQRLAGAGAGGQRRHAARVGRRLARVRGEDQHRRHLLLGPRRLRGARQRRHQGRVHRDARLGHRRLPREPRGRRFPHVRAHRVAERAVLGVERLRAARRRQDGDGAGEAGRGHLVKAGTLLFATAVVLAGATGSARAAGPRAAGPAQAQFDYGLAEMEAGRYASGCPALAESYRVDPHPGVLFTLAECENKWGKIASALTHYEAYLDVFSHMAEDEKVRQRGRDKIATAQRERLRRDVPTLTIVLPASAGAAVVTRDGAAIGVPSLGVPLPVDPGEHVVVAKTPDGVPHEGRVSLSPGEHASFVVDLSARPAAPVPAPVAPAVEATTGPSPWVWVAGGIGAAGARARRAWRRGPSSSGTSPRSTPSASRTSPAPRPGLGAAEARSRTFGALSDVGFGVAGAGAVAALALLLASPSASATGMQPARSRSPPRPRSSGCARHVVVDRG